jgi:YD repeat-containing protein
MRALLAASILFLPTIASAQTTEYKYDALGRLTAVTESAGPSTAKTAIAYDPAGNRTSYKVTDAPAASADNGAGAAVPAKAKFIVVPLNGFTLIPIS